MSSKRVHSPPSSLQTSPVHKSARATTTTDTPPLLCTLPPTCNKGKGTPLDGTRDLEAHYAKYHAHVCSVPGCECVFPDARLLELHLTECHDPLADVRKERGEKIFACHLATCPQYFRSPKNRRLHLIQAHGYPKEYFFAVTNKGVGELLRKWGDGASLVRGTWKARDQTNGNKDDSDDTDDTDEMDHDAVDNAHAKRGTPTPTQTSTSQRHTRSDDVDALANGMSSLSLVPSSIRFGRGAKSAGHVGRHAHGPSHLGPQPTTGVNPPPPAQPASSPILPRATAADVTDMDEDQSEDEEERPAIPAMLPARGRGRGRGLGRGGRGRGRVLVPPRGGPGMHRGMFAPRGGRGRGG